LSLGGMRPERVKLRVNATFAYERTAQNSVNGTRKLTPWRHLKINPLRVHVVVIRSLMATGSSQCGQVPPAPTRWHGLVQSWHHCWPR
jgi:hypothetical protein